MLSICIPVYNYDVTPLVHDLHKQAEKALIPYEILLIDDASEVEFKNINQKINLTNCKYVQLEKNIGRSKIRNLLAKESQYSYLIFMDCDSAVSSNQYISNYLPYCKSRMVCYGGRCYEKKRPMDNTYLRWKYGVNRESDSAKKRRENPNFGFCTNNFLIDKEVLNLVEFNESLSGYGHEDTLFGLDLYSAGIIVQHIDNPLIHIGLEASDFFIRKTENGLRNLHKIEKVINPASIQIINHTKIIKVRNFLKKWHIQGVFNFVFQKIKPCIKLNLLGKHAHLFLFDIYKLGYFCGLDKLKY